MDPGNRTCWNPVKTWPVVLVAMVTLVLGGCANGVRDPGTFLDQIVGNTSGAQFGDSGSIDGVSLDQVLRDHPGAIGQGNIDDLNSKLLNVSGSEQTESAAVERQVSEQRNWERDRRAGPVGPRGPDKLVLTRSGDIPRKMGLRRRMKPHPEGDDIPKWQGSGHIMDSQEVRFEP